MFQFLKTRERHFTNESLKMKNFICMSDMFLNDTINAKVLTEGEYDAGYKLNTTNQ